MDDIFDVAEFVIEYCGEDGNHKELSTMRLHKLLYYCQAWHIVFEGEEMFSDPFHAWASGPISSTIMDKHKGVFSVFPGFFQGCAQRVSYRAQTTIEAVLQEYGTLSGIQLCTISMREDPWQKARKTSGSIPGYASDTTISIEDMEKFYSQQYRAWEKSSLIV